jgi:TfoX/Sxy family transcriptional regulator of competence genes
VGYDEHLADRVRALLAGETVEEKVMFGGLAFMIAGKMCVAADDEGALMVRIDPSLREALLEEPGAGEVQMGRRSPMKGWLRVGADAVREDAALSMWVRRAVQYTGGLPARGEPWRRSRP